jgi:hypothetical protein
MKKKNEKSEHKPRRSCKKTDNKTKKNIIPTEIRTRVAGLEGRNLNHCTTPTWWLNYWNKKWLNIKIFRGLLKQN